MSGPAPSDPAGPDGSPVAQWLHDEVVPLLMAAGLRVELANSGCSPEAAAHLEEAAQILDELARSVRAEMARHSPQRHLPFKDVSNARTGGITRPHPSAIPPSAEDDP